MVTIERSTFQHAVQVPGRTHRPLVGTLPIVVLVGIYFAVTDVGSWLAAPYWGDEAWVALSTRFPISDLPVMTSSSPIGWTLLLRFVPDVDYLRVVPLGFQLLTVVAAFAFGRLSAIGRTRGVAVGVVAGLAIVLLPAQQVRHDLKQYTADAAVAVTLLTLAVWTERSWSHARLSVLTGAVAVGMFLSHTTAVVAACVFAGLLLAAAMRRKWRQLIATSIGGLVSGGIVLGIYLAFSARGNSEAMRDYWTGYFPRLAELPAYLDMRADLLLRMVGIPALVLVALLVLGAVVLLRSGYRGTVAAVLLLPCAMTALGVAQVYPLLDIRTSHFLIVIMALMASLGVVGLADLAVTLARRWRVPRASPVIGLLATCTILVGSFVILNHRWFRFDGDEPGFWRSHTATTDVRSATRYVMAHATPDDIVVVAGPAWFGFALYSELQPLTLVAPVSGTVGWTVKMPIRSGVIFPQTKRGDVNSVRAALDRTLADAAIRPPGTRVWLIQSYDHPDAPTWKSALTHYRIEEIKAEVEPVILISRG